MLVFDFRRWIHIVSDPLKNHPVLTRMVAGTRQMLDEVAKKKGRKKIILGVRVGSSHQKGTNLNNRRAFLKKVTTLPAAVQLMSRPRLALQAGSTGSDAAPTTANSLSSGWKRHLFKQDDGRGGWIVRTAEIQYLHRKTGGSVMPFGVTQMDNGEVILAANLEEPGDQPVVAFSPDNGQSWTEFQNIEGATSRPVMLTYLGKGNLMLICQDSFKQCFSGDYGRTWPERRPLLLAPNGEPFHVEGNALVDRGSRGVATRIAAIGWNFGKLSWPAPQFCFLRWSNDGGRTWSNETMPKAWRWEEVYKGKSYTCSVNEGSLVRAANGWLVAALRTGLAPKYLDIDYDQWCGTGVSVSKDDGITWSPVRVLYDAGRMHAHLLRLRNGNIVMTYILRQDIESGRLASYRRGCEAIISHDNGLNWDLAHRYILDDWEYADGERYTNACGHVGSALLNDGSILTCYGNYPSHGACLIRWRPTSE